MDPATYAGAGVALVADTCEPLQRAAGRGEVRLEALARAPYPGDALEGDTLAGVRTVGTWDAGRPQTWGLDWHRNEGVELTFLATGALPFATDDGRWTLRPGDVTITRPWQRHRLGDPHVPAGRLHWVIVDVGVRSPADRWDWPSWLLAGDGERQALTAMLRGNEHPVWRSDRAVADAFAGLASAVGNRGDRRERWIAVRLNELLLAITGLFERRDPVAVLHSGGEAAVERFLDALPDRVGEPWTLDAMAAACGLGRTRFAQHCRTLTNRTPQQVLTALRVDAARRLLADPRLTVTDVAHACGFATSQHFATVFRRATGERPSEAARRMRAGRAPAAAPRPVGR